MHRDYVRWWSPSLGRDMEMLVFGHAGTPVLAFPSSMGRFHEWEDFNMIDAVRSQLEAGHNMVFCIDSVDAESFYNKLADPYVRIKRHEQYEQYVFGEVLPFIRHRAGNDFIIAAGASFGGYHAANVVLKQPWQFGKLIALSGAFDIRSFLDGFYDDNVYYNNPVDYVPGLQDSGILEALRKTQLVFTVGEHDPCRDANFRIHDLLNAKGIPHTLDVLHGAFGHDWPWWRALLRTHIA